MIAVVKRWHAVLFALPFFFPPGATAADDVGGAARELARKTAGLVGKGASVAITWRNLSSLESTAVQARAAFESALQDAGVRLSDNSPAAEARLTVSENATQFLLVEEASKGDEHQVWLTFWKRSGMLTAPTPGITLEKKLLWEQDEQILDVAFPAAGMLVLGRSNVTLYTRSGAKWEAQRALPLIPSKPWPADLRGRLQLKGPTFQVYLPGTRCEGSTEAPVAMECRPSDDAWVLESGSRSLLLASYNPGRNYFDGKVTSQSGQRKTVPPFFSAASVESQGRQLWVLTAIDGRTQIFDGALDPVGTSTLAWGSDLAGTDAHCGAGSQILATRPGDGALAEGVQAFTMVDRTPVPLTESAEFPGPVVALWTSGGSAATVVVRDLRSGKYAAYTLTVVCGG